MIPRNTRTPTRSLFVIRLVFPARRGSVPGLNARICAGPYDVAYDAARLPGLGIPTATEL